MKIDTYKCASKEDWRLCLIPGIWVSKYTGRKKGQICIGFMWLFWGINFHFNNQPNRMV